MSLDFQREYGVNAGYVQALFEEWKQDASRVDESWRALFERAVSERGEQRSERSAVRQEAAAATATATEAPPRAPERPPVVEPPAGLEPLAGVAARIAVNM